MPEIAKTILLGDLDGKSPKGNLNLKPIWKATGRLHRQQAGVIGPMEQTFHYVGIEQCDVLLVLIRVFNVRDGAVNLSLMHLHRFIQTKIKF